MQFFCDHFHGSFSFRPLKRCRIGIQEFLHAINLLCDFVGGFLVIGIGRINRKFCPDIIHIVHDAAWDHGKRFFLLFFHEIFASPIPLMPGQNLKGISCLLPDNQWFQYSSIQKYNISQPMYAFRCQIPILIGTFLQLVIVNVPNMERRRSCFRFSERRHCLDSLQSSHIMPPFLQNNSGHPGPTLQSLWLRLRFFDA